MLLAKNGENQRFRPSMDKVTIRLLECSDRLIKLERRVAVFISLLLLYSQMSWTDSIASSELVFNSDESQDISAGKNSTLSERCWDTQHRNVAGTCDIQRKEPGSV